MLVRLIKLTSHRPHLKFEKYCLKRPKAPTWRALTGLQYGETPTEELKDTTGWQRLPGLFCESPLRPYSRPCPPEVVRGRTGWGSTHLWLKTAGCSQLGGPEGGSFISWWGASHCGPSGGAPLFSFGQGTLFRRLHFDLLGLGVHWGVVGGLQELPEPRGGGEAGAAGHDTGSAAQAPQGLRDFPVLAWPGPGEAGRAGLRKGSGQPDALSTQCARPAAVRAHISLASARPRRAPGCPRPWLLLPQSVSPSICYSAQLPGWGSSLPEYLLLPMEESGASFHFRIPKETK